MTTSPRPPDEPPEPPAELRPGTPEEAEGSMLSWAIVILVVVLAAAALLLMR